MAVELGWEEIPVFSSKAVEELERYRWPGNIRELKNVVERAVYRSDSLKIGDIIFDPFMGSGVTLGEALKLGCRVIGKDINPVSMVACESALNKYDEAEVFETLEKKLYSSLEQSCPFHTVFINLCFLGSNQMWIWFALSTLRL